MNKNTFLAVTTSALACSLCTLPAPAVVTPAGDVDPTPPVDGQGVTVGDDAVGSLTIDGGSGFSTGTTTNDQSVIIGNQVTGDGTVLVDGAGSSLETLFLRVGVEGTAQFTASNGASVSVVDDFSIRGDNSGTVTGAGTVFQAGDSIFINGPSAATLKSRTTPLSKSSRPRPTTASSSAAAKTPKVWSTSRPAPPSSFSTTATPRSVPSSAPSSTPPRASSTSTPGPP